MRLGEVYTGCYSYYYLTLMKCNKLIIFDNCRKAKLVPPPSYFADPEPANSSQAAPDDR